ncbi:MAG: cytochrome C [Fidelibacterota bacterium]|nr:MAG: cytochrome C [Candidatus Neomarinimicrobiota bacterium]
MAQIFPRWTNRLPLAVTLAFLAGIVLLVLFVWYYFSPWYTDVGYRPVQPVPFSHKFHAGELGLDCRYCHVGAEISSAAMVPPTKTCMNCHTLIKPESELLGPVRDSWETGSSLQWIRIHEVPDYAYFNHSPHIQAGVGCFSCHGDIAGMEVVELTEPLSMSWCLDCHRDPADHLRPMEAITSMDWQPPPNQSELATDWISAKGIDPPLDCSGCHR